MKNFILQTAIFTLFLLFCTSHLLSQNKCAFEFVHRDALGANSSLRTDTCCTNAVGSFLIPVAIHVFASPVEQVEFPSDSEVTLMIDKANSILSPHFTLVPISDPNDCSRNTIRPSNMQDEMTFANEITVKNMSRIDPDLVLNIWLLRNLNPNSAMPDVNGWSYSPLPNAFNNGVLDPLKDGIVLQKSGLPASVGRVLAHEFGHYMSLHHVWGEVEGLSTNCGLPNTCTSGDFIADTAPCLRSLPNVNFPTHNTDCTFDQSHIDAIVNANKSIPFCGPAPGFYPCDNIMALTHVDTDLLTPGQFCRMISVLEDYRPFLGAYTNSCISCTDPCDPCYFGTPVEDPNAPTNPCNECFAGIDNSCYSCTEIPPTDINITQSAIFNQTKVHGTLTIESGATLRINTTVEFTPISKIIVEMGAKLIVTGGVLTKCNDQSQEFDGVDFTSLPWDGVHVAGNWLTGQPDLNGPPIAGKSGFLEIKNNGVVEHATTGIRNYKPGGTSSWLIHKGGLIDIQAGSTIANCDKGIDFEPYASGYFGAADDKSQILNSNFITCDIGIYNRGNSGVEVRSNDFDDCAYGMEIINGPSMTILSNEFFDCTEALRIESPYPAISGLNIFGNSFNLASGNGIVFDAQGNAQSHYISGNAFLGYGSYGIIKFGINYNDIFFNDFIDCSVSIINSNTGLNYNNTTSDNSIISSTGVLSDGNNHDLFISNCFDLIEDVGIHVLGNSSIYPAQLTSNGEAASNCFNTIFGGFNVKSELSSEYFDYFIKEGTVPTNCQHPGSNGNYGIERVDDDVTPNCGSQYNLFGNIPPRFRGCEIPQTKQERILMEAFLVAEIIRLQNDTTLPARVRNYLIARVKRCLDKLQRENVIIILEEEGRDTAIVYASSRNNFDIKLLAYSIMVDSNEFTRAQIYLPTLTISTPEQTDFITGQLTYLNYLIDPIINYPTEPELNSLRNIGLESNEYSGFARSAYYLITGNRVPLPFPTWTSPSPKLSSNLTQLNNQNFLISPNPFTDQLNISFEIDSEILVEVYNISGKLITDKKLLRSGSLDLATLNQGVYIIKISNSTGIILSKKIVKL